MGTGISVNVSGLSLTGARATNYTLSLPLVLNANITNKAVTINSGLSANSKVYDRTAAATITSNNVSLNGVVAGDAVNISTNGYTATFASTNVGTGISVSVSGLSLTGARATNYTLSQPLVLNANITPAGLTLTASNQAKVYGQTLNFAGTEFGVSGLLNGDSVSSASLSSAGSVATAAVAGSPYSIVISNAVGNGLTNYTISYVNGLLTMTPALLGVSANNTNRVYGATNPVFTVSYNGFVNGDGLNVLSGSPVLTTSAVTNSPVGNYTITNSIGSLVATNYLVSLTNGVLTIGAAGLTLTASNQAKVYGQTLNFAGTEFGVSGLLNGDSVSSASLSSAGSVATAAVAGSPYSIVISNAVGNGLTNYTISYVNGLLTMTPALLGVSANNTNRVYGATNPVFTVSYNGFVNGDGLNVLSGSPVLTTSAVTNSPVGNYVITNSLGSLVATNYLVSLTNGLLTINAAGLTLTASNQAKVYGQTLTFCGTEFGVSGLLNGDSVSSASLSSAGVSGDGGGGGVAVQHRDHERGGERVDELHDQLRERVVDGDAGAVGGECEQHEPCVRGDQSGVHGQLQWVCERGRAERAVRVAGADDECGDEQSGGQLRDHEQSGEFGGDELHGESDERVVDDQPGVIGSECEQHEPSVRGGEPCVHGQLQWICERGRAECAERFTTADDQCEDEQSGGQLHITNSIGSLVATNYTVSLTNGLLTINPALLGVSANNTNRVYGAANPVFTVSYSGFVNGDGLNVLSGSPVLTTSAVTNSPVGNYAITNSIGSLVATNYTVSLTNGLLTINPALLGVSANNTNRVYGAANPVFTVSYSGFVNGDGLNVLSGSPLLTTSAKTNSPVGNYAITNSIGSLVATNYAVSLTNGTLTVTGAVLTATANNATRAYGAANPVFTVSYSGFVNGDGTNVLSGTPLLSTSALTNSPVGSYVITNSLGTLVATNYTVSLTNGTLTVTGAVLTATVNTGITANNKVYDGTTAATISLTNVVLTGVVSGDTVSLSTNGYTANFASAGVGTGIGVTISGLSLTGPSAGNYTLVQPVGLTANITAKALTIASAVPPPVITSIQLTNGVVTITWSSVTGGIYRAQYINSLNGGGWTDLSPDVTATGSTATQTNAVGNATQRYYRVVLLNPGLSANNKVYDGTTAATINLSNVVLVGVVNGDSVSLVTNGYTANFASAGVGTNIPVSVGGLTLTGGSATNYTLTQPRAGGEHHEQGSDDWIGDQGQQQGL